jgi:phosphoribosylformylglycinamidine (FGAM) synthase-like enzyme
VRGLADGCRELGIPVTGGNVSFYNQTGSNPILPTPVVGVLGVLDDVRRRTPTGLRPGSDVILLIGGPTLEEFCGGEWAHVVHGHLGGRPPRPDLDAERRLARVLVAAARRGLLSAAHDLSDGGLAQALVEACLINRVGARVVLPSSLDPFVALFSESAARVLVALPAANVTQVVELCAMHEIGCTEIGVVSTGAAELAIAGVATIGLPDLAAAWESTLPTLFA